MAESSGVITEHRLRTLAGGGKASRILEARMTIVVQVMGGVARVEATAGEDVMMFYWDYLKEVLPEAVFERTGKLVKAGHPASVRDLPATYRAKEV